MRSHSATSTENTYDGAGGSCDPTRPHPQKAHAYDGGGRSCGPTRQHKQKAQKLMAVRHVIQRRPYPLKTQNLVAVGHVIQLGHTH